MRTLITLLFAILACASAWMLSGPAPIKAPAQCAAPIKTEPKLFMALDDDALDNPNVADDDKIMPARKCGFCMG